MPLLHLKQRFALIASDILNLNSITPPSETEMMIKGHYLSDFNIE